MKLGNAKIRVPSHKLNKIVSSVTDESAINIFTDDKKGQIYYLDIGNLIPFKSQARHHFNEESINLLSLTIKEHGIRQPLTVIKSTNNNKFEIVSGERRFLAAKIVDLQKIPCIIINDYSLAEEIALIENIQREDLHPLELGQGYKNLYISKKLRTHDDIARKLGISRTQVTEYMRYTNLPEKIKKLVLTYNIKERIILRKLLRLNDEFNQEKYIKENILEKRPIIKKSNENFDVLLISIKNGNIVSNFKNLDKYDKKKLKEELVYLTSKIESL